MNGALRGETPAQTRIGPYDSAIAGGEVIVAEGPAAGTNVTTDASGAFELHVPPGPLRLRFSKPGFRTQTSSVYTVAPSTPLALGKVVLDTAPWALTGVVRDGRANPVTGATVTLFLGGAFPEDLDVTTDSAGRYRYASDRAHFSMLDLSLSGTGIEPILSRHTACCSTDGDTVADLSTLRVLRVIAYAPATLRVGDAVELQASTVLFDDGSQRMIYLRPDSSAPGVLSVSSGQRGWVIRANGTGEATLTMEYRGLTDRVHVVINPDATSSAT